MTKDYWIRSLAIAFTSFFAVAGISITAQSRTLVILISRLPHLDGGATVEMDVGAFVHLPNGQTPSMIRPGVPARPNFVFDSISDFKEATIGEWTIEDQMTPFSPRETFKFQVSDFFDTISSIVPPTIVSPRDGAVVPSVFTMSWAWPPGVTPQNSKATSIDKFGPGTRSGASSSARAPSNDLSEEMMAAYSSGGLPATVEVRAGSWHPGLLDSFFSEVVPQQGPSLNTYTIATYFYSYSLPASLYVGVPEPSAITLLAIGIIVVTVSKWRRKHTAKIPKKTTIALTIVSLTFSCAVAANADTFGSGATSFDIELVTIGNPGNPADDDSANPNFAGSVPYQYRVGKFEVSREMINKANAEGLLGITLADMSSRGGNRPNMPATGVSWNEAARFVNWLNISTGNKPAYKFVIQPGEVGYNPNADIETWAVTDEGYNPENWFRNSQARYVLPSVNEWYKAAFYDPNTGTYFDYPTGSNVAPTAVAGGTTAGSAVYEQFQQGPADITNAGGLSPYGTMAQAGNVYEWEETTFWRRVDDDPTTIRGARGGYWGNFSVSPDLLSAMNRVYGIPTFDSQLYGFRIASIPEPSPGDFNQNGNVDAADYIVWRKGLGTTYVQADYDLWRAHFGETTVASGKTAAVPEPATWLLVLGATVLLQNHRRRV